jgi:hypothetical protein
VLFFVSFVSWELGVGDLPGDFPGEAPQKTQILTGRGGRSDLGFRFERMCVDGSDESPSMEGAGEAPPDAIVVLGLGFSRGFAAELMIRFRTCI